jgi:hypothetical protein
VACAAIGGADGFIADDFAGVPEVALIVAEKLLGAGHEETVGGVPLAALAGFDDPAQARGGLVYAEGIDAVFAAQIRRGKPLAGAGLGNGSHRSGKSGGQKH